MSDRQRPPQGDKVKIKAVLFFSNIFISALCIISILGYFLMPLWDVKITVAITPELVEQYAPQSESSKDDDSAEAMITDILRSLSKSNFRFELSGITLDTYSFVSAATGGTVEPVKRLIDANISGITASLSDAIHTVVSPLVKSTVSVVVEKVVKKAVKEIISVQDNLDEKTQEALKEMGISAEYIDENVSGVIDAITAEDASVNSVKTEVMNLYDDVIEKLEKSETYGEKFENLSDEDKQKARDTIENTLVNVLNQVAEDDGSINLSDELSKLVLKMLGVEEGSSVKGETAEYYAEYYPSNVAYADEADTEDAAEQVKAKILAAIMEKLDDKTVLQIAEIMKYVGYVLLFTFFTWAYLILKMLIKIPMDNPGIKLKLPIWFGYIPFTILVILPTAAITAVRYGVMDGLMGEGANSAKILLNAVNITFSSGGVFSFVSAIVLFIFSFIYMHYRNQLKKIIKYEKRNGKI
ncbi:MAG: hypothetical protein J5836_01855 [Clostridia bacterium]|nr:hypothetical protein [Clostridia bacterium]